MEMLLLFKMKIKELFLLFLIKIIFLIGTTEVEVESPDNPKINEEEIKYLIKSVNNYFIKQINPRI